MAYIRFLSGVQLDNSYNNPIYFDGGSGKPINLPSGITQISYKDYFTRFDGDWDVKGIPVNFSFGDGINTSIVVSSTYFKPSDNYAIVILDDNDINISQGRYKPTTYFYFVTSFAIYGKNNYRVELELDVMTTFLPSLQIGTDVFVERKHCNRWGDYGLFNVKDAILGDELDGSFKASVPSQIIYPKYNSINTSSVVSGKFDLVNNWINDTMWVYLFFSELPKGVYTDFIEQTLFYGNKDKNLVDTQVCCIPFPCKPMYVQFINDVQTIILKFDTSSDWFKDLTQHPSCIGAKLSFRSPFSRNSNYNPKIDFYTDENGDSGILIPFNLETLKPSQAWTGKNGDFTFYQLAKTAQQQESDLKDTYSMLTIVAMDDITIESDYIDVYNRLNIGSYDNFYKNIETINARDKKYEPKLFCNPYYNLVLTSQFGSYYNYNPLLFSDNVCKVVIYCNISPEPDKIYTYVKTDRETSPYYYQKDLNIGSVVINDNNIPYRQDAYAQYLSSHRSSVITSLAVPLVQTTKGLSSGLAGAKNVKSVVATGYNFAVDVASTAISWRSNIVDLQNTPDTIKNLGNNPTHDLLMYNSMKPYLVVYKLFENEENQVYQYYYDNGYCINRENTFDLHNFNKESILTRRLFNYVKLNENIVSKMTFDIGGLRGIFYVPQPIKNKINNILNRGCKIWTLMKTDSNTDDMVQYYLTNEFENSEIII